MRAPTDLPRRPRRTAGRGRAALVVVAIIAFILITSVRGIAGFYTDYLWFDSLGRAGVWRGVLGAKLALAVIFTGGFFVILWTSLFIADKLAPPFRPAGPEEEFVERYHEVIGGRTGLVRVGLSLLLALIAGTGQSAEWEKWILFTHGGSFGVKDPQFDTDVGFYVFKLPFLSFLVGWLFAALIIVFIVTAVFHYLNGGIRLQTARERVTPQVKAHLSVLLGLLALVKAAGYILQRYELTVSTRGAVDGATYTDVKAQLPAINLLLLISIAAFVLFIVNIFRRGWVLPVLGVGLWALVAVIAGGLYPQFVQRFQVQPSESSKEAPYIARNIEATRAAMGLATVDDRPYVPNSDPGKVDLNANAVTVSNIRLWDPSPRIAGQTFQQLQRVRQFYKINDVDIDRYTIKGKSTEMMLGVRGLDTAKVPQKSWEGRHLSFTHGYGVAMAPTNGKTADGQPGYVIKNVPIDNQVADDVKLTTPGVYFGEDLSSYVVVGTARKEVDFQDDKQTQFTAYKGADGVKLGSLVRRMAFSLRFGDVNPMISSFVDGDSKILYIRDIRERAKALAPFLHFDADPYAVVVGGKIQWVLDAYTTTDRYPYAQRADTSQLTPGSGLDHRFNYARNSVKAVVDAYEGTVSFYVMPGGDPIIAAYRDAFPKLFSDFSEMPKELSEHLRYPEDLFRVQTNAWGRYHITDPDDFYNKNDAWNVAQDPDTASAQTVSPSSTSATATTSPRTDSGTRRIEPYYLVTRLPGEKAAEFVILRPFVPLSEDDTGQLLTAFMVARTDGDNYGKLVSFTMPRSDLPLGPALASGSISGTDAVSQAETLLGSTGSKLLKGNLILVPIQDSLLYVRPYFVEAESTKIPKLERVIALFNNKVVIKETLAEALTELFGETPPTLEQPSGGTPQPPTGTIDEQIAKLLTDATRLYTEADGALAAKDLGTYQKKNEQARAKVDEAARLLSTQAAPEGGGGTPSSTTSTTEQATA